MSFCIQDGFSQERDPALGSPTAVTGEDGADMAPTEEALDTVMAYRVLEGEEGADAMPLGGPGFFFANFPGDDEK